MIDRKTLFLVVLAGVVVSVIFIGALLSSVSKEVGNQDIITITDDEESIQEKQEIDPVVKQQKQEITKATLSQKEPFIDNTQEEYAQLYNEIRVEQVEFEEEFEDFPARKYVTPLSVIRIAPKELANLHVGSKLVIPDIEGSEVTIEITGGKQMDGSSSYIGTFSQNQMQYPSLITVGEDGTTYIHVQAPHGSYEIELKNAKGYLYSSEAIHQKLSDDEEDTIEVKEVK